MNTKRLPDVLIVVCLVALAAWYFWPAKAVPAPAHVVLVRRPPPVAGNPGLAVTLAPEPVPTVPVPSAVVPDVSPPPAADDSQADLSTAIPDFIRMAQFGDFAALMETYMPPSEQAQTPDDQKAKMVQEMKDHFQTPEGRQDMQQMLTEMQSVVYLTPSYDATGNTATYKLPAGSSHPNLVFVKENGRWYLK